MSAKTSKTRDPNRIPRVLAELKRYWETHPDTRLGQLLVIAAGNKDPFYLEDEALEAYLFQRYMEQERS